MLSSSVFRAMLRPRNSTHAMSEASTLQATGRVEIPLPEDDLDAMLIILRIIHHRYAEVSRHISRSVLAQVAILVDKYDLRKSVEFVSTTWFDNFGISKKRGTSLPAKFCNELLEWLFVSWVFGYADIFFSMTRIAMAQSWCRLDNDSLPQFPFPNSLIGKYCLGTHSAINNTNHKFPYNFFLQHNQYLNDLFICLANLTILALHLSN